MDHNELSKINDKKISFEKISQEEMILMIGLLYKKITQDHSGKRIDMYIEKLLKEARSIPTT